MWRWNLAISIVTSNIAEARVIGQNKHHVRGLSHGISDRVDSVL